MNVYSHVLVVSGGMDSATLAYLCVKEGGNPYLITFDYGQKHNKELLCAGYQIDEYHAVEDHKIIDIKFFLFGIFLGIDFNCAYARKVFLN